MADKSSIPRRPRRRFPVTPSPTPEVAPRVKPRALRRQDQGKQDQERSEQTVRLRGALIRAARINREAAGAHPAEEGVDPAVTAESQQASLEQPKGAGASGLDDRPGTREADAPPASTRPTTSHGSQASQQSAAAGDIEEQQERPTHPGGTSQEQSDRPAAAGPGREPGARATGLRAQGVKAPGGGAADDRGRDDAESGDAEADAASEAADQPDPALSTDTRPIIMPQVPLIASAHLWGQGSPRTPRPSFTGPSALDEVLKAVRGTEPPSSDRGRAPAAGTGSPSQADAATDAESPRRAAETARDRSSASPRPGAAGDTVRRSPDRDEARPAAPAARDTTRDQRTQEQGPDLRSRDNAETRRPAPETRTTPKAKDDAAKTAPSVARRGTDVPSRDDAGEQPGTSGGQPPRMEKSPRETATDPGNMTGQDKRPRQAAGTIQGAVPSDEAELAEAVTAPMSTVDPGAPPRLDEPQVAEEAAAASSSKRQLLSGTTWQAAAQFIPLVLNLAITPYVIKHMGDARWGLLMGVNVLTAFLSTLDGGVGQAAMRYFSIYAGNGDKRAATRLLVNLALFITLFGSLVFSAVFVFSDRVLYFDIPTGLRDEGVFLLRTMTVIVAIGMVRQLFASLLFSHNLFRTNTVGYLIGHLIYMAGLLGSIRYGWGLYGVAWAFVIQQGLATLLIVPRARKLMDLRGFTRMSWAEIKEFWHYAWKIQVAGLMTFFMFTKDQLVIGRIEPVAVVGYYGQGAQFAQQLRLLPSNALSPIQGILGRAYGSRSAEEAAEEFATMQRLWVRGVTGWCAVGIPAAYFGVSHWLPPSFAVSGTVAAVLLVGHLFAMWPAVLLVWCLTLGRSEVDLKYGITTMIINVALTAAFIPTFGAIGTVYASTISLFCGMVALSLMASRALPFPVRNFIREVPWLHAWVAAVLCFTPEFLLRFVMPSGGPALIVAGLAAVPAFTYYVLAVFGVSRLREILARLRGRGGADPEDTTDPGTAPSDETQVARAD